MPDTQTRAPMQPHSGPPETAPRSPARPVRPILRAIEFVALFIALPLIYAYGYIDIRMIPFLLLLTLGCVLLLLLDHSFPSRLLWNAAPVRKSIGPVLMWFIPLAVVIGLFTLLVNRDGLFEFPRRRTTLWLIIMCLYPIFSVYPQELICRTFFFHRYGRIFGEGAALIVASALAFAFMHIVLLNWIAVLFTFVGGLLFSFTYARTKSLLLVTIEHALYGCWIFTIGLGTYFYGGDVDRREDRQSPSAQTSHTMNPGPEEAPDGESVNLLVGLRQ